MNEMTPAVRGRYLLYAFGWIYVRTTCRLGFCPVYTFNGLSSASTELGNTYEVYIQLQYTCTESGKQPRV
jgi:hypothetical protein